MSKQKHRNKGSKADKNKKNKPNECDMKHKLSGNKNTVVNKRKNGNRSKNVSESSESFKKKSNKPWQRHGNVKDDGNSDFEEVVDHSNVNLVKLLLMWF